MPYPRQRNDSCGVHAASGAGSCHTLGTGEAIFTSVTAMLGFNYFFLPPIGNFTIQDTQNWVALLAFLVTAVIASQLSSRAKARAEEASARRSEVERLYSLSRAMLMDETTDVLRTALLSAGRDIRIRQIVFHDLDSGHAYGSTHGPNLTAAYWRRSPPRMNRPRPWICDRSRAARNTDHGSLGFEGANLTTAERDSVANLIAINFERAKALDRATAAEAARRGERLKTFLLDGIAHDLKTPLTAIKTCVTTLITFPPRTEETRAELLSIIDEETDRLQRTITEALQLARIESGKFALNRQPIRMRDMVERTPERIRRSAASFELGSRRRTRLRRPRSAGASSETGCRECPEVFCSRYRNCGEGAGA